MKPVCLVIGAGAGIGGNVAKKFARQGYYAVLCRRSDRKGLDRLVDEICSAGGEARGQLLDALEKDSIENLVEAVEKDMGPIRVAVYNLGAQIGNRPFAGTSAKTFELGWRLGCFGLYRLAAAVTPLMVERGEGTLLVTSATAAMRGNAGQHSHAAAMGARRMLCQTLNAEFGPRGIHIAHILIDGMVDAPDTLGKMLGPQRYRELRETRGAADGLMAPELIAETYYHIAGQHRCTWTHELDLRSFSDLPWWNTGPTGT